MRRVYLDHAATTPVDPAVAELMAQVLREVPGNPSSIYAEGRRARALVDRAREEVAQAIGADPTEIVFTSGGTEADNLALRGVMKAREGEANGIVTARYSNGQSKPAGPAAREIDNLFKPVFLIAVAVFVLVQALVLIVIIQQYVVPGIIPSFVGSQ